MRNNYFFKRMLGYSLLLFCAVAGNAQTPLQLQSGSLSGSKQLPAAAIPTLDNFCRGTVLSKNLREALGTDAAYDAIYQQNLLLNQNETNANRAVKVLPTVVHVIYGNATENISDARVNSFIAAINAAFSQTNNQSGVRTQFQSVIGNPQVQFCLATTDPSGNPTTGIIRKSTTLANFEIDDNAGNAPIKKLPNGSPTWNPQKYVNIWIVDIGWQSGASGGTAGYAYLPNSFSIAPGAATAYLDGLVVDVNATFGTSQGDYSIGIHELGHYLGLPHTFPDGASSCVEANGDGFTDTPPTNSATQTGQACSATITKCSNTVQTENFMDYQIHCHQMFTLQQANYMNNTILNPTNGFRRLLLWNGCAAPTAVAPVANFTGCNSSVAQNSTVTFTDASTGIPTSWAWSITPATGWTYVGGTSATSQNPQVQFTTAGNYTVALTATNAQGSNTKTSTACITVVAAGTCTNLSSALTMGFEASESLTGWLIENTNNDVSGSPAQAHSWIVADNANIPTTWQLAARTGTRLAVYRWNSENTSGPANDWLFTPCMALQSGQTYSISFWYKSAGTQYPEKMKVSIGSSATSAAMTQQIVNLNNVVNTVWTQSTNTFTVPTSGNYNIGFQCYSAADQFYLALEDINIFKPAATQPPVANFTGCGNYAAGTTVTFTNTSTNSPTSNSWSITPATGWSYTGGTNASSANPQVTFTTAGSYTVALTATNAAGSNTKTTTGCVVVAPVASAPVASFTGCGNYITGNTVTLTSTSTNNPTSYAWSITPATGWSFVGGTNASSASPQIVFTSAGNYNVSLTATNSAGSNTKVTNTCIVVGAAAVAPLANFTGCGNYSSGSTVTFTNTSTNSPTSNSWSITPATGWSFTGGTNATSISPQVTFTTAGNYTVSLTATNSAGSNTKTSTNCAVVSSGVVAPVANFTGCGSFATGSTITLTNSSTNSPTSYSWAISPATGWAFAGGTNAASANPQITFSTNGTYTVTLTATNSAGSDTKTSSSCVVVNSTGAAPEANFLGCPGTVAANTVVTFANTSTNLPTTNLWAITPPTGWSFAGGTNENSSSIQVQFTAVGSYTVTLTSTNSQGSGSKSVMNCVEVDGVGINESSLASGITLYPNPTTGITTLSISNPSDYTNLGVAIYNAVGVQMYKTSGNLSSDINLDLSTYSAGVYFIEIRSNEATFTKRLILSR
jgi:PKD repeat protein